jgi:arabinogalactan endo-1,4-beta-galactosidase
MSIGGDLSYVNTVIANSGVYLDAFGNQVEPFAFFASKGANMVRVRLWHTPENIVDKCGNPVLADNLDDVILAFQQAKAEGMKLNLSIHYGDYFNDPGCQEMPKAWKGLSQAVLIDSVYNYTYQVLEKFKSADVLPDIVSVGNETTWGFIDETNTTDGWSWPYDADKFNIALQAIDNFNMAHNTNIKKAVHFTQSTALWLAQLFKDQQITGFDMIGISFYPIFSDYTSLQDLGNLIEQLISSYNKEVMIFETGVPWTQDYADEYPNFITDYGNLNYPTSPEGQRDYLLDLAATVYSNGGLGIIYWEPGWISSGMCDKWGQGSSYENAGFFDFNNGNRALPAFDVFSFCNTLDVTNVEVRKVSIFPNPTTSVVNLTGLKEPTEIQLKDHLGRTLKNVDCDNDFIDLSGLPSGVYFVFILSGNELTVKKILKE